MAESKEIYSMIYGGWKKTDVRDLVVVRCKHYYNCSLYKNGFCAKIPSVFSPSCPFGYSHRSRGYSERAVKYSAWESEIKNRPSYDALKDAPIHFVAIVDDNIVTPMYAGIYWNKEEQRWAGPGFGTVMTSIPITELTPERLMKLYNYAPHSLFGPSTVKGCKTDRDKWFTQLKEMLPDVYNRFIQVFPDVNITVSYIGREARIDSLHDGVKLKSANNCVWEKRDGQLVCENYNWLSFGLFNEKKPKGVVICDITPNMTYKIDSNDMVDGDTVFVN
jgi:hypothetical protein